eukprot:50796_1
MGTCLTSNATHINENIEQRMKEDQKIQRERGNTLILLGTQCSGKTTILQNLQILQDGRLLESKDTYLNSIRQECISTIIHLLNIINDKSSIKLLNSFSLNNPLHLKHIAKTISNIWIKYNGFKNIITHLYAYKDEFDFNDNIEYFINNIHRIMSNNIDKKHKSILNNEDIIKFHTKELSISSYDYIIKYNRLIEIIDLDIPIKKLHCVPNVYGHNREALIYVCALNSYCKTLKDTNMNAMQHSLNYFETICNIKWFRRFEFILFLNKDDIFQKRLRNGISLSVCFGDKWNGFDFPDYEYNNNIETIVSSWIRKIETGIKCFVPNEIKNLVTMFCRKEVDIIVEEERELFFCECYQESIEFIKDEFIKKNKYQNRVIFSHVTVAIDIESIEKVFWDVQNIVIRCGLKRGGLIC